MVGTKGIVDDVESEPEKKSVAEIVNMFEKETRSHEEQTIEDVSGSDEQTQKADLVNDEVVIVDTKEEYHISQDSESSDASPVAELPVDVENETVPVHKMVKIFEKIHSQSSVDELPTEKRQQDSKSREKLRSVGEDDSQDTPVSDTSKPHELEVDTVQKDAQPSDVSPVIIESLSPVAKIVDDIKTICEGIQKGTEDEENVEIETVDDIAEKEIMMNVGAVEENANLQDEQDLEKCSIPSAETASEVQNEHMVCIATEIEPVATSDDVIIEEKALSDAIKEPLKLTETKDEGELSVTGVEEESQCSKSECILVEDEKECVQQIPDELVYTDGEEATVIPVVTKVEQMAWQQEIPAVNELDSSDKSVEVAVAEVHEETIDSEHEAYRETNEEVDIEQVTYKSDLNEMNVEEEFVEDIQCAQPLRDSSDFVDLQDRSVDVNGLETESTPMEEKVMSPFEEVDTPMDMPHETQEAQEINELRNKGLEDEVISAKNELDGAVANVVDDGESDDWELLEKEEADEYQEELVPFNLPSPTRHRTYEDDSTDDFEHSFHKKSDSDTDLQFQTEFITREEKDKLTADIQSYGEEKEMTSDEDDDTKEIDDRSEKSDIESPVEFVHEDITSERKSVQFDENVQKYSPTEEQVPSDEYLQTEDANIEDVEGAISPTREDRSIYIDKILHDHEQKYGETFAQIHQSELSEQRVESESDNEIEPRSSARISSPEVRRDDFETEDEVQEEMIIRENKHKEELFQPFSNEKITPTDHDEVGSTSSSDEYTIRKYEFDQEIKEKDFKQFVPDDNVEEVTVSEPFDTKESSCEMELKVSIHEKHEYEHLSSTKESPDAVCVVSDIENDISRTEFHIHKEDLFEQSEHDEVMEESEISKTEYHVYEQDCTEVEANNVILDITKMDISTEKNADILSDDLVSTEKAEQPITMQTSITSLSDEDLVEKPGRVSISQDSPVDIDVNQLPSDETVFIQDGDETESIPLPETTDDPNRGFDVRGDEPLDEYSTSGTFHGMGIKVDSFASSKSEEDEIVSIQDDSSMQIRIEKDILTSADVEMEGVPVDFVASDSFEEESLDKNFNEACIEEEVDVKPHVLEVVEGDEPYIHEDLDMKVNVQYEIEENIGDETKTEKDATQAAEPLVEITDQSLHDISKTDLTSAADQVSDKETSDDIVTDEIFSKPEISEQDQLDSVPEKPVEIAEQTTDRIEYTFEKEPIPTENRSVSGTRIYETEYPHHSQTLESSVEISSGRVDSTLAESTDVSERMSSTLIDSSEFETSEKDVIDSKDSNEVLDKSADLLEFEKLEQTIGKMETVYDTFSESQILEHLTMSDQAIDRVERKIEESTASDETILVEKVSDDSQMEEEKGEINLKESGFEDDNLIGEIQETYIDRTERFIVIQDAGPFLGKQEPRDGRVPTETVFPDQLDQKKDTRPQQQFSQSDLVIGNGSTAPMDSDVVLERDESAESLAQISRKLSKAEVDEFEHEIRKENEELEHILQSETMTTRERVSSETDVEERPLSPSSYTLETDTDMEGSRTFEPEELEFEAPYGERDEPEGRVASDIAQQIFIEQAIEQKMSTSPSDKRPPSPSEFTLVMSHDQEMLTKALGLDTTKENKPHTTDDDSTTGQTINTFEKTQTETEHMSDDSEQLMLYTSAVEEEHDIEQTKSIDRTETFVDVEKDNVVLDRKETDVFQDNTRLTLDQMHATGK